MPNTSGSTKKKNGSHEMPQTSINNNSGSSTISGVGGRARKRKRCEIFHLSGSDLESEFEDCNLDDAISIEKKLRKVAKRNSLSDEEMRKLLQKFVKNEHVLALVTLQAEDELARERREAEQRAIIITDTPSVAKLTRAKARELNKTPGISLPTLSSDAPQADIAVLIKDDLHSDEEDEEYTFKEEDFISDDDINTTASDMESNPRTPLTPLTQTDGDDSPVKFSTDGCFKLPLDKRKELEEDLRIAARTRSKLCLQQTTIEDIQSEFVPPDVEQCDMQEMDMAATDADWMQFLNDFSKPLNTNLVVDDDDPINDPEYVAAEKIPVDAEELRDVNISKKELTELVAELFEGLINEGVSLESIDLDTPQKFLQNNTAAPNATPDLRLNTPRVSPDKQPDTASGAGSGTVVSIEERTQVMRQINFDDVAGRVQQVCVSDATISSTNITQNEYSFHPNVMSTPSASVALQDLNTLVPIAYADDATNSPGKIVQISACALNSEPQLIAVPVLGQPNCFQLAKVLATGHELAQHIILSSPEKLQLPDTPPTKTKAANDTRYSVPYDNNFTWEYISIRKHVYSEYMDKFESLRHVQSDKGAVQEADAMSQEPLGFTQAQHDMLQQQLRIHVQLLTQHFVQTYSHPDLWKWASNAREMLMELQQRATLDASFNAWNLQAAVELSQKWENDLTQDTPENKELMEFMHNEIEHTNRNTRQIPRFPPRIMDLMLNSSVFMYPQFLPRIPFTPKVISYHAFSPAESQLIALGLEKHMKLIHASGERFSKKAFPLVVACGRLSKDTVFGKTKRRIWDHIKVLRKAKYYNPVKYFFEHNCAPPVERQLFSFENNTVQLPRERFNELPLAWQKYVENKNNSAPLKATATYVVASKQACASYLEFVREAVGEDIQLPEHFEEAAEPNGSTTDLLTREANTSTDLVHTRNKTKRVKKLKPTSLTINVNYVFGAAATEGNTSNTVGTTIGYNKTNSCRNFSYGEQSLNKNNTSATISWAELQGTDDVDLLESTPVAYNFDLRTQTLQPVLSLEESSRKNNAQRKLTDFYDLEERGKSRNWEDLNVPSKLQKRKPKPHLRKFGKRLRSAFYCKVAQRDRAASLKHRRKLFLRRRCHALLIVHRQQLHAQEQRYQHAPLVQQYYRYFRALYLYSELLRDLNMFCRNVTLTAATSTNSLPATAAGACGQIPNTAGKRARSTLTQALEDETGTGTRSKKANRQEENFRHMLLPDTPEDANRKDAIYAFNFYEKVEEVLKSSKRPEDCKRFNHILKSFDPKHDKVSDLYYKMENLLLPDYPELAQVFLTFLLPSEAAAIGKFFEHFMITNMATFINKLNVYFNKQPAQIRKIYNCLNELSDEQDVTIKKIKIKILPLLKGNQFLIDWFMQQFPEEPPPERLLSTPEHVNLKEVQNNQSGEFMESVTDLLDSPTQEQSHCQLRYINGRIFYGSKITLPAKLSFMAANYSQHTADSSEIEHIQTDCIHAIREHGEKRLAAAVTAAANEATVECNSDDNDKSEEEEISKALIIDTTGSEEDNSSSIDTCDDATLRAHAMRLNPNHYGNACYASATSTPNLGSYHSCLHQHANAKKSALNFTEEGKISPRKPGASSVLGLCPLNTSNTACHSPNTIGSAVAGIPPSRDKRKSPTKKTKSPVCASSRPRSVNMQPMVVIHEQNSAIACAKKLKSLIEEDSEPDNKESFSIVARTKESIAAAAAACEIELDDCHPHLVAKVENPDDLEFLPENAVISGTLSQSSCPVIKVDVDSNDEQEHEVIAMTGGVVYVSQQHVVSSTHIDSDEDRKLDIVASLATSAEESTTNSVSNTSSCTVAQTSMHAITSSTTITTNQQSAWTRDEDKIILIEMKLGSRNRDDLFRRIRSKLPPRTLEEIVARHQFLMDFLSKLQGK